MTLASERRARDDLPDHLQPTDEATVECEECGVSGLRPIGHTDECSHEHVPRRGDGR